MNWSWSIGLASILVLQIASLGYAPIPIASAQEPHPDFQIECAPSSLSIEQGASGTTDCTVQSIGEFSHPVDLFCQGLVDGVSCNFSPNQVMPQQNGNFVLNVIVDAGASPGTSNFEVVGVSGSESRSFQMELVISTAEFCDCQSLKIKPAKDPVKVTKLERVAGRGRGAVEVKVEVAWVKTIVCEDKESKTDKCVAFYSFDKDSKWKVNVPKNKKTEGVDGTVVKEKFIDSGTGAASTTCVGFCDGREVSSNLTTEYSATIENADRDAFTNLQVKGTVHLQMTPSFCKDKQGWNMFIVIDSTRPGNIDDKESDFDGDGLNGHKEEQLELDPFNPDTDGNKTSDGDEDADKDGTKNSEDNFPTNKNKK